MSDRTPTDVEQWAEALLWLNRADLDLRAVEALLSASPPLVDTAAFHCQQAAEKIAKAVLVAIGHEPPHIHDIARLSRLIRDKHPEIADLVEALAGLTDWYISGRYPGVALDAAPNANDVRAALGQLRTLRRRLNALAPDA